MSMMNYLLDLLYPPGCLSCEELLLPGSQVPLCPACHGKWEELRRIRCPSCKKPQTLCACVPDLLTNVNGDVECIHLVPYRNETIAGKLILLGKDERLVHLTDFLADQLQLTLSARGVAIEDNHWVLTYLPRSRDRVLEKGIDQSRELAKALGMRLNLPISKCFDRRNAPPQKELNAQERFLSAQSTYWLRKQCPSVKGAHILLIDDIITSGATMAAGCNLLFEAGAKKIYCISVGMTMDKNVQDE